MYEKIGKILNKIEDPKSDPDPQHRIKPRNQNWLREPPDTQSETAFLKSWKKKGNNQ
jgi:hypothetical protein